MGVSLGFYHYTNGSFPGIYHYYGNTKGMWEFPWDFTITMATLMGRGEFPWDFTIMVHVARVPGNILGRDYVITLRDFYKSRRFS